MALDISAFILLYKMYYPAYPIATAENDVVRNPHHGKLQLRCNKCSVPVVRFTYRLHGNPMCGVCYNRYGAHLQNSLSRFPAVTKMLSRGA